MLQRLTAKIARVLSRAKAVMSGEQEAAEGGNVPGGTRVPAPTMHFYLGDVDDLPGGCELLQEGGDYWLPVLPLEALVLLPGASMPLLCYRRAEMALLQRSLEAPQPTTRLIAVMHWPRHWGPRAPAAVVGCSAEIRQLTTSSAELHPRMGQPLGGGIVMRAVARGRQRLLIHLDQLNVQGCARVCVLDEGDAGPVPRALRDGYAAWAPWAARPWDCAELARSAVALCGVVAPAAGTQLAARVPPLSLSYWLAAHLPVDGATKQALLEARGPSERLRGLLRLLRKLGRVRCGVCGRAVADARAAVALTEEGAGGAFVNAHGHVHDMVTFTSVVEGAMRLEGQPETEHSWFPGYAWTSTACSLCSAHLGWRFTAAGPVQPPAPTLFWGLRRDCVSCAPDSAPATEDGSGGSSVVTDEVGSSDAMEFEEDTAAVEEDSGSGSTGAHGEEEAGPVGVGAGVSGRALTHTYEEEEEAVSAGSEEQSEWEEMVSAEADEVEERGVRSDDGGGGAAPGSTGGDAGQTAGSTGARAAA